MTKSLNYNLKIVLSFLFLLMLMQLSSILYFRLHGQHYPLTTFLFRPPDRFGDLVNLISQTVNIRDLYIIQSNPLLPANYLPTVYLIFYGYSWAVPFQNHVLFFLVGAIIFTMLTSALYAIKNRVSVFLVLSVVFISYPVLFAFDRLNTEVLIMPLLMLFVLYAEKWRSVLFLVSMGLLKITPLLFGVVYIKNREWKFVLATAATAIFITYVSYLPLNGSIAVNIESNIKAMQYFNDLYTNVIPDGRFYSSSFSNILFLLKFKYAILAYLIAFVPVVGMIIYRIMRNSISDHGLILVVSLLTVLIPSVSFDYKLCVVVFAIINYLVKERTGIKLPALFLFALIISPFNYLHIFDHPEINLGVFIRPILMYFVLVYVTFFKIKND